MVINIKKYRIIVLILLITHINTYADTTNKDNVIHRIFHEVNDELALYFAIRSL